MKKVLLLLLTLLFSSVIYSQENPEQGFIITNDNDTIYGLVDYRTDIINNKQCLFKAIDKDDYVLYHPGEIVGYRFDKNGRFYVSKTFEFDGKRYDVFAEFMVKGMLNVYRVCNVSLDVLYFFENEKSEVVAYRCFKNEEEFSKQYVSSQAQNLYSFLSKSSFRASDQVKVGNMNSSQVIDIARVYHEDVCTSNEDCIEYEYDTKNDLESNSFILGMGYTHFFETTDYAATIMFPVCSIGVETDMGRLHKGMSLVLLAEICRYKDSDCCYLYYTAKIAAQFKLNQISGTKLNYRVGVSLPQVAFVGLYGGIGFDFPVFNKHALFVNFDVTSPSWYFGSLFDSNIPKFPEKTHVNLTVGVKF